MSYHKKIICFNSWLSLFQGMLTHWTKKIIVEEGHTAAQLVHILQLVVRHFKVYYPVRHHLIQHMINSKQRLGLAANVSDHYIKKNNFILKKYPYLMHDLD